MTAETAEPGTEPSRNPRLTGTLLPANWRVNRNPAGEGWSGRSDGIERSLDPGYASTCLPAGRIGGGEVACLPRSLSAPACRHATCLRADTHRQAAGQAGAQAGSITAIAFIVPPQRGQVNRSRYLVTPLEERFGAADLVGWNAWLAYILAARACPWGRNALDESGCLR
jgi:hypothetical protein